MNKLQELLKTKQKIKIIQAHDPLSACIAERAGFDAIWSSSLADSASQAVPDCEYYGLHKRTDTLRYILNAVDIPVLMDVDSGGYTDHLAMHIRNIAKSGVSGVVVEDKVGYKRNSLYGPGSGQTQDTPENFAYKLRASRSSVDNDFLIVARIESLILGETVKQALDRANCYLDNGANAIMIHSVEQDPVLLLDFVDQFSLMYPAVPLVVVPTTFTSITADELFARGVNVVIYANHMIRAAVSAMMNTAQQILDNDRSLEADQTITSVKDLLELIPENDPAHRFH